MEILKPGKKLFGTYICDVCGCEFKAALHECSHRIDCQETRIAFAECPNCKVLCEKNASEFEEEPGAVIVHAPVVTPRLKNSTFVPCKNNDPDDYDCLICSGGNERKRKPCFERYDE